MERTEPLVRYFNATMAPFPQGGKKSGKAIAEPDLVRESGPTYGGAGDYTAVAGTTMHRRMFILKQLRQRLQESGLASTAEQKSTEDLYPATRTLAEIRRERYV